MRFRWVSTDNVEAAVTSAFLCTFARPAWRRLNYLQVQLSFIVLLQDTKCKLSSLCAAAGKNKQTKEKQRQSERLLQDCCLLTSFGHQHNCPLCLTQSNTKDEGKIMQKHFFPSIKCCLGFTNIKVFKHLQSYCSRGDNNGKYSSTVSLLKVQIYLIS